MIEPACPPSPPASRAQPDALRLRACVAEVMAAGGTYAVFGMLTPV